MLLYTSRCIHTMCRMWKCTWMYVCVCVKAAMHVCRCTHFYACACMCVDVNVCVHGRRCTRRHRRRSRRRCGVGVDARAWLHVCGSCVFLYVRTSWHGTVSFQFISYYIYIYVYIYIYREREIYTYMTKNKEINKIYIYIYNTSMYLSIYLSICGPWGTTMMAMAGSASRNG